MAARATTIEVKVDLDDFDDDDLIEKLEARGYGVRNDGACPDLDDVDTADLMTELSARGAQVSDVDPNDAHDATESLRNGRMVDALVMLERALPREWSGILTKGLIR